MNYEDIGAVKNLIDSAMKNKSPVVPLAKIIRQAYADGVAEGSKKTNVVEMKPKPATDVTDWEEAHAVARGEVASLSFAMLTLAKQMTPPEAIFELE